MTTEEFTGHLLAALHGPRAMDIVDRIVTVVLEHDQFGPQLVEAMKARNEVMAELTDTTAEIAMFVLADHGIRIAMFKNDDGTKREMVNLRAEAGQTILRRMLESLDRPELCNAHPADHVAELRTLFESVRLGDEP